MEKKKSPSVRLRQAQPIGSAHRILIVDDDESTCRSLSLILGKKGYETEAVRTGREAIEKAKGSFFNAALLDIRLPDMEGTELIAPLKKMHPDMVLIIITGYASLENAVQSLNKGASAYITKPLNMDEVLATIREISEKQRLIEGKKQVEAVLRESQERIHTVVSNAPIVMWSLDKEGIFTLSEGFGLKALGLKPGEIVGQSVFDVYCDAPKILEDNRRALAGESFVSIVEVGDLAYESHYSPLCDENGEVIGMIGVSTDITERKKAEEALQESEVRYRALFENTGSATVIIEKDTTLSLVNQAFENLSGFSKEELEGKKSWTEFVAKENLERMNKQHRLRRKDPEAALKNYEFRFIAKDGKVKDIFLTIDMIQGTSKSVASLLDITDRKQTEEEKLALAEIFQRTVQAKGLQNQIFRYCKREDGDFVATFSEGQLAREFNMTTEYIAGKTLSEIVGEDNSPRFYFYYKRAFAGEMVKFEAEFGDRCFITTLSPFGTLPDGTVTEIIGSVVDITERKRTEEQIKASLREKEVLLQEIHHRVKNNMQIISSLLRLQTADIKNKKMQEILGTYQNRIRSMTLVHEKLYRSNDFARINLAHYIQSLTGHLFNIYRISSNIVRLRTDVKDIFLDINRAVPCGLIISELISNSLKHGFPEGRKGEICVKVHSDKEGKFTLIVSDNGVGIPKELDIHKTGTLGLRLVTLLGEQLKGSIELDREGGTTFKITF